MMEHPTLRRQKEKLARAPVRKIVSQSIIVRMYPEEVRALKQASQSAGKSMSAYVREACFNSLSIVESSKEKKESTEDCAKELRKESNCESISGPARENGSRIAENLRENVSNCDEQVEKRTGHRRGCECFACVRLREMISAPGKKARGRPAKKKVVPLFVV